jgi:hypothetical protein
MIDRNFGAKKRQSIAKPSGKMLTHSHSEGHLQVLTPKVRGYGDRSQLWC